MSSWEYCRRTHESRALQFLEETMAQPFIPVVHYQAVDGFSCPLRLEKRLFPSPLTQVRL